MKLGRFSLGLNVKNLEASRAFYEGLGFTVYDDHRDENWLIMRHGHVTIGLFQGMFNDNIMTFNPPDARAVQAELKANGVAIEREADGGSGPTYLSLVDPDGNQILIDQFDPEYVPTGGMSGAAGERRSSS